jgi:hypothetical protein
VELRFEQDSELRITNGALRALGTQEVPVRMVANQSVPTKGYWRGVVFTTAGSASELSHVTLSDCGRDTGDGACITLRNRAAPVLRNVTVRNSATVGVQVADEDSAFGTGSTMLSIAGSESYAAFIYANQAGTLPTGGSFTGNKPDAVEFLGNVTRSQTWPNLGIPYIVNDFVQIQGTTSPTLTLSAGTMLRFGPNYGLFVGARRTPSEPDLQQHPPLSYHDRVWGRWRQHRDGQSEHLREQGRWRRPSRHQQRHRAEEQ